MAKYGSWPRLESWRFPSLSPLDQLSELEQKRCKIIFIKSTHNVEINMPAFLDDSATFQKFSTVYLFVSL